MTPRERDLFIRTLIGEAGNQPAEGQAAVAHVIQNRLNSGRWGNNLNSVILAPKQFSLWNAGDPAGIMAKRVPEDSPQYQRIGQMIDSVRAGQTPDPTGGALNYYNPRAASPDWGPGMRNQINIGAHRFGTAGGSGSPRSLAMATGADQSPVTGTPGGPPAPVVSVDTASAPAAAGSVAPPDPSLATSPGPAPALMDPRLFSAPQDPTGGLANMIAQAFASGMQTPQQQVRQSAPSAALSIDIPEAQPSYAPGPTQGAQQSQMMLPQTAPPLGMTGMLQQQQRPMARPAGRLT